MASESLRSGQPALTRMRIFAAAAIFCALAGVIAWRYWRTVVAARENRFSIAVLPFTNLSADPANQYFADGLTDEITDLLARNRTLRVSARASASQFGTKSGDLGNVGRKLNVANVLEGSVDRSRDRIRIIAHLERVADGSHIWSNTYERQSADLFAVQSELAQSIAGNLKAAEGLPSAPRHVPGAQAHDLFLKGRYELQQLTPASLNLAEADFQQAVDLDPAYAAAYAGLGTARYDRSPAWTQLRMEADRKAAEEPFRKALELDPDQTGVHAPLAAMKMQFDWDWAGAERELKQALAGPPDANANVYYAYFLIFHGRLAEADTYLQRAQDLDPFGSATLNNLGLARFFQGRYSEALEVEQKVLSVAPNMIAPQLISGAMHVMQGHPDVALADFEKLEQRFPQARMYEAMAQAGGGHRTAALLLMRPFEEQYPIAGVPMQWFALAYGLMGDEPNTVKWLGRSADARDRRGGKPLRGLFPIGQTPCTPDNKLDLDCLAAEVKFCNRGGVHGFVWPQIASGWAGLTQKERMEGAEAILAAGKGGKTALVIGVQTLGGDVNGAVEYANTRRHGADAIVSLPPEKADANAMLEYYKTIGKATDLPLFVQSTGDMSVDLVVRMFRKFPPCGGQGRGRQPAAARGRDSRENRRQAERLLRQRRAHHDHRDGARLHGAIAPPPGWPTSTRRRSICGTPARSAKGSTCSAACWHSKAFPTPAPTC
jgi:TolB-like protein/Tfp pilus assembly protein PilF